MRVTPERYRQIAVASLVALFVVIVAGAAVRLTNSGLGCDDWPNCNETTLVDVSSKHAAIEQVNRLFNGIVTVAVLTVGVLSHRVRPRPAAWCRWRGRSWRWWRPTQCWAGSRCSSTSIRWRSRGTCCWRSQHSSSTSCSSPGAQPPPVAVQVSRRSMQLVWCVAAGTAAAIVAGTLVTGSGPHAGDEDAPRLDLDIESIARVHGVIVIATIVIDAGVGIARQRPAGGAHRARGGRVDLAVRRDPPGRESATSSTSTTCPSCSSAPTSAVRRRSPWRQPHLVLRANPAYADGSTVRTLEVGAAAT